MKRTHGLVAAMAILLAGNVTPAAQAQPRLMERWERLGCVDVGRQSDLDVIHVGRREGRFTAIRLEVSGNDVHINDLKVVYGNGESDDIRVRTNIREGSQTRPLDLRGRERAINRIEIVSRRDQAGPGRGRGQICVSGLTEDLPQPFRR